jgi:signal transduction histidine kinase
VAGRGLSAGQLGRAVLAVAAAVASVAVTAVLERELEGAYLLLPLGVVLLAALLWGVFPAMCAAVVATPGVSWLLGRVQVNAFSTRARAATFLAIATVLAGAGALLRRAYRGAEAARDAARLRERRNALLAALGVEALAAPAVEPLLDHVASTLRVALGVDLAWLADASGRVLLRPHALAALPGSELAVAGDAADGQIQFTLKAGGPVVSPELEDEHRFDASVLLASGFRSTAAVPVWRAGRGAELSGVLGVASRAPRGFTRDEIGFLQIAAALVGGAVARMEAEAGLRAAAQARDDVLAIVSHDLKNPLGAILAGAALLARVAGPDERVRRVGVSIDRAAQRMERMIRDLGDLAALDSGQLALAREPHDPSDVCREAIQMLEPVAQDAGVALDASVAAHGAPVLCDRGRILQVLANLITNAVRATDPGGHVSLRCEVLDEQVAFRVADTGRGIPPDELPHLFDRYWRGRSATYRGSGIGLAIARALVEAHSGRIWAESVEGEGSTFGFTLPRAP